MRLVVLPGDGIGPEITAATVSVLQAAAARNGLALELDEDVAGHASFARYGTTIRDEVVDRVRAADGLILGPMATFEFTDEAKGGINPSKHFRKTLDLFANIRPARSYPGLTSVRPLDLVVVRENTEGFYADRNMAVGGSELQVTPDLVISLRRITRECCMRIARAAFELAEQRSGRVTAVHKANVLKIGDGMFLECCRLVAQDHPGVVLDEVIVDAMMAHVVRSPERFDVIVTTNMFGDILSDLTAELSGSLGMAGSLNAGVDAAMAQAAHGSAPDIAGKGVANPFSLMLSVTLLLDWHARRRADPAAAATAAAINAAIAGAIAAGEVTGDIGGRLGTHAVAEAVIARLAA